MATYQDEGYLKQVVHRAFDREWRPGDRADWSGIYRCTVCGTETAINAHEALPDKMSHQHSDAPVTWVLVVYAEHPT